MKWIKQRWNGLKDAFDLRCEEDKLFDRLNKELKDELKKHAPNCDVMSVSVTGNVSHYIHVPEHISTAEVLSAKSIFKNVAEKHGWEFIDADTQDLKNERPYICGINIKL